MDANRIDPIGLIETELLPDIRELYAPGECTLTRIDAHEGGRNVTFRCENGAGETRIIRVSYLDDRTREDYLSELEYVRYLRAHGGSVAGVIPSVNGRIMEEITRAGHAFTVCAFENAPGDQIADHGYQYRPGAPLSEYFFNCGSALGRMHEISKGYVPEHRRFDFFDKYNPEYVNDVIPDSLPALREKLCALLTELDKLPRDPADYGMVHFDFSDGNYNIDYATGAITAFDFDNCRYCWYLYDLANLWVHGTGWTQFEPDIEKRRRFMDEYFNTVIAGYRSQTAISDAMLARLPLMLQAVVMESIIDEFEVQRACGEWPDFDEELAYHAKCITDGIPYVGFFDAIYSTDAPFQYGDNP